MPGYCCVEYSVCPDENLPFSLDSHIATSLREDDCLTYDHILIPESSPVCQRSSNSNSRGVQSRYCGMKLNYLTAVDQDDQICGEAGKK